MTPQLEPLPFDSVIHEDLFKLFILASNEYCWVVSDRSELASAVEYRNLFQYNDRTIAEVEYEEYERFVSDTFMEDAKRKMPIIWDLRMWKDCISKNKIKFRFVEDV